MADGPPRVESLLLELVGALLGRSDRSSRHHSRSGGRSLSPEHCRCCSRRRHSGRSPSYDRRRRSPVDRRSRERSRSSGRSGRARSRSRETYRHQRSQDRSPRRARGSSSSYASAAVTSSASHMRFWAGSSAGRAAATTRTESTTIPTLIVENSRRGGHAAGHQDQSFRGQGTIYASVVRTSHVPGRGAQVSRGQEEPAEQPAGTSSIPRSSGTRPCIVAGCTYHGRTIEPHFFREHFPKNLSLNGECRLQVQVLNRLSAELRYTSLQLLVDSVFTSLDVKDLTFNEALVAAMQKLSLHTGGGVPTTTTDFLRQRSPAFLLHRRVLGSLLNRMSEKRRAGFAKWDPPELPFGEASDLVVRSIDRFLDEEEKMDQLPAPTEPKLTGLTPELSMAAEKEQPRQIVSASSAPAGATEARTVDPPAPTSPTTTASPKPKVTTSAVTPRPAPTSLPMLEVYDSHFHLDRNDGP